MLWARLAGSSSLCCRLGVRVRELVAELMDGGVIGDDSWYSEAAVSVRRDREPGSDRCAVDGPVSTS